VGHGGDDVLGAFTDWLVELLNRRSEAWNLCAMLAHGIVLIP
jgi:hypothetical protein